MINASELRLGNIIGDMERVCEIRNDWTIITNHRSYKEIGAEPILITGELLIRFGFELISKHSFWNYKLPNGFKIGMWMDNEPMAGFEEKGVCYWGELFIRVRYVHELQNLYYAVTKQELTNSKHYCYEADNGSIIATERCHNQCENCKVLNNF